MQVQLPCEQFGAERAKQIDDLILAATGARCPGLVGGICPLTGATREVGENRPDLRVIAS